jgi:hypothetical protein
MKAVRPTYSSMDAVRSIGISTGNHLIERGVQRNYPSGPSLQLAPGEPLPPPKVEGKSVKVTYNNGNCYKCGSSDSMPVQAWTPMNIRSCNNCKVVFLASKDISEEEYMKMF